MKKLFVLFSKNDLPERSVPSALILLLLPVVYAVLAYLYYFQTKAFFTTFPDSTYIYLINGLNIANGNFDVGHYDNPGTTAHWLVGIIIFIAHIFIGKGTVVEDVLSDPELYLKYCAITCIALIFISVFASGRLIMKNTGNLSWALFFQLVPISAYMSVNYMVRSCPEYMMIMVLPIYSAFLWNLCYRQNRTEENLAGEVKNLLALSFFTAVLVVGKITCLPLAIVPLFLIKKLGKKAIYVLASLIFAALLLFPVWPSLQKMFDWFWSLATHTGIYGAGEKGIIDGDSYKSGVLSIFRQEIFFTIGYVLVSLLILIGVRQKKWKDNLFKLSLALWLAISAQIAIAAKHYEFHYMIPSQLLIIPTALAGLVSIQSFNFSRLARYCAFTVCGIFLIFKMGLSATNYINGNEIYKTSILAKKYENTPKIITTTFDESCFVESALRFGATYGGKNFGPVGIDFLINRFHNSYFYDSFMQGGNGSHLWQFHINVQPFELLEKNPRVLVYFRHKSEELEKKILDEITAESKGIITSIDVVDYNPISYEKFYMINVDTALANSSYSEKKTILCGFEKLTDDNAYFVSADGFSYFGNEKINSTEKHTSGNTSAKATPEKQYVCWANFPVKPGDKFEITVNMFTEDNVPGAIQLSATNGKDFLKTSSSVVQDFGNGWKKIRLLAKIPSNYPEKEVHFTLYYFGKQACYFDDLSIIRSKK